MTRANASSTTAPRRRLSRITKRRLTALLQYVAIVAVGYLAVATMDWPEFQRNFLNLDVAVQMFPRVLTVALVNTLIYSVLGFAVGIVLGLVLALMKTSNNRLYRWVAILYIEVFRGLPALLVLFFIGYGIPIAYGHSLPGGTIAAIALGIGLIGAAYMGETIRAGIQSVPRGELEAAKSLGMPKVHILRHIVIPQAFRTITPPLMNEFIALVKDSSLVYVLGVTTTSLELTKFGRNNLDQHVNVTPLFVVGLCYLVITFPLARIVEHLESKRRRARQ